MSVRLFVAGGGGRQTAKHWTVFPLLLEEVTVGMEIWYRHDVTLYAYFI